MSPDLSFDYINHRGEFSRRLARYISHRYGSSQWHPNPQWLMMALDLDKNEPREFAMMDMTNVEQPDQEAEPQRGEWRSPLRDLIRRIDVVAQNHLSYSQACGPIGNLRDHLSAMAFCEEVNRREMVRSAGAEVARSEAAAPDAVAGS